MSLVPVARVSLSDHVFEQLSDGIVAGRFEVGSDLPSERSLCEALQVNRGAVREAVKRLAQAGLVASQHGSGHHVLDFRRTAGLDLLPKLLFRADGDIDLHVVRSVMEMRAAVGPDAAALCARRASPPLMDAMRRCVAEMRAAEQAAAVATVADAEADESDHGAIAMERLQELAVSLWHDLIDGSDNIAYRLAYNALSQVYEEVRPALLEVLGDEIRDVDGCAQIVEAVARGDEEGARQAARALIGRGTDALNAAIALLDLTPTP